jgi:xanthine dehydrogenase accessory factor
VVRPETIEALEINDRTAVVIMSHHYLTDRAFLKALLHVPLRYLGLMGPRGRARKMIEELRQEGFSAMAEQRVSEIHNPVGLDIGAETPAQIALAILAEIQAVTTSHAAGLLREKKTSIHAPPDGNAARTSL